MSCAREVTPSELADAATQQLIDDLVATMRDANGAGLAANQVHVPMRICAIEVTKNPRYPYLPSWPLTILVNPVLGAEHARDLPQLRGLPERCRIYAVRSRAPNFTGASIRALDRHGSRSSTSSSLVLTAGTFPARARSPRTVPLFVDRVVDTRTLCTLEAFDRFHREEFAKRARDLVAAFRVVIGRYRREASAEPRQFEVWWVRLPDPALGRPRRCSGCSLSGNRSSRSDRLGAVGVNRGGRWASFWLPSARSGTRWETTEPR